MKNIINLKELSIKLHSEWKKIDKSNIGLSAPFICESNKKKGIRYQNEILKLFLKNKYWEFLITPNYGETPADIIGFRKYNKEYNFILVQVKGGKLEYLKSNHEEIYTLPILKKLLKGLLKSKNIIIPTTIFTCFIMNREEIVDKKLIKSRSYNYFKNYNYNSPKKPFEISKILKKIGNDMDLKREIEK